METTRPNALDEPVQAPPRAARVAVAALFFFNGFLFASWASRIPAVQTAHGLNNGELGLALLAIGLGAVVAMPVAGLLIGRIGSRRVCMISASLYAVFLIGMMLASSTIWFVAALFCFGANHGAVDVAMNAQAVAVERRYGRPIMSSFHALWSTGGLSGAALGGLLAARGLPFATHIISVTAIAGVAMLLAFLPLLDIRQQESHRTAEGEPQMWFRLPSRALLALGLVAFCVMIGEGAMADWIAVYLRNNIGSSESLAAAGYATFSVMMAAGRFFGDGLAKRWGAAAIVRGGSALAAAGLFLALISTHTALALVGIGAVGAGLATTVPLVFSAAGRTRNALPGIALASVTTLGYLGFLVGPPLIGFAAQLFGLRAALGLVVLMSALASVLASSLREEE